MLDDEAFAWTPNYRLRVAGETKNRQSCDLQRLQNIKAGRYGRESCLGIKMGISANSSSLCDATAITPILDSAESVAEQVMGGHWAEEQRNMSTVASGASQGETKTSLRTTARLERCGCCRSCSIRVFFRYAVCQAVAAVALEEKREKRVVLADKRDERMAMLRQSGAMVAHQRSLRPEAI